MVSRVLFTFFFYMALINPNSSCDWNQLILATFVSEKEWTVQLISFVSVVVSLIQKLKSKWGSEQVNTLLSYNQLCVACVHFSMLWRRFLKFLVRWFFRAKCLLTLNFSCVYHYDFLFFSPQNAFLCLVWLSE